MNKKRCANCNCSFSPKKHIVNQLYCTKKRCQNARRNKWMSHKLKYDKDYKANKKESQYKWKTNNPNYWAHYKKSTLGNKGLDKEKIQQEGKINKSELKKPILKISVARCVLVDLYKTKKINCNCNLVLTS